jgi:hypothetical protein
MWAMVRTPLLGIREGWACHHISSIFLLDGTDEEDLLLTLGDSPFRGPPLTYVKRGRAALPTSSKDVLPQL